MSGVNLNSSICLIGVHGDNFTLNSAIHQWLSANTMFWCGNLTEKDHLEDLGVVGCIKIDLTEI